MSVTVTLPNTSSDKHLFCCKYMYMGYNCANTALVLINTVHTYSYLSLMRPKNFG